MALQYDSGADIPSGVPTVPSAIARGVRRERLFRGSCCALAVSAVAFAVIGDILLELKKAFILTNLEIGYVGGAAIWGAMVTILIFGPLCDVIGMRPMVRAAMACHIAGVIVMMTAREFSTLLVGALTLSLGNGLIGATCNPLVATLYPDQKTVKLNQLHFAWPAGIVAGGLASYGFHVLGIGSWQLRLTLILIPAFIYIPLMIREPFPTSHTEGAGISWREMFQATFTSPLLLLLLFCMLLTASIELGPNRWIPAVLKAGGIPGILVLVWISGLMAGLRFKAAGLVVRWLSPVGVLFSSVVLAGTGLFLLSFAESGGTAFLSGTIFAIGVAFLWPTMLGLVAERIPRSGALGLALMGGAGMGIAGLVTAPALGRIADTAAHEQLVLQQEEVGQVLQTSLLVLQQRMRDTPAEVRRTMEISISASQEVLEYQRLTGKLPQSATANALRSIVASELEHSSAERARAILASSENYGGRISFRYCVPVALLLAAIFGLLLLVDRRRRTSPVAPPTRYPHRNMA